MLMAIRSPQYANWKPIENIAKSLPNSEEKAGMPEKGVELSPGPGNLADRPIPRVTWPVKCSLHLFPMGTGTDTPDEVGRQDCLADFTHHGGACGIDTPRPGPVTTLFASR